MKVTHKNSGEKFDLSEPRYIKLSGTYGYLTATNKRVFFLFNYDGEPECEDVTEMFEN